MRRLMSILVLAAACGVTNAPADRAEAIVLTGLHGIDAAIDDSRVAEQAHCRPDQAASPRPALRRMLQGPASRTGDRAASTAFAAYTGKLGLPA